MNDDAVGLAHYKCRRFEAPDCAVRDAAPELQAALLTLRNAPDRDDSGWRA